MMVSSAHAAHIQAGGQYDKPNLPVELGKLRTIVNEIGAKPEDDDDAETYHPADQRQAIMDVLCSFSEADVTAMNAWANGVGKRPLRFHAEFIKMHKAFVTQAGSISTMAGLCVCIRQSIQEAVPFATWWIHNE